MAPAGIRLDDDRELARLKQRFGEFYLIGFMYGAEGTNWYALPKEAPDEDITRKSAAGLLEALVHDHEARQEQRP